MLSINNRVAVPGTTILFTALVSLLAILSFMFFVDVEAPIIVVSGSSMVPSINSGDVALIHRVHPGELAVGDIIAFKENADGSDDPTKDRGLPISGQIIVHRVVDIQVDQFGLIEITSRGDFNLEQDDNKVNESNYIGKAYAIIPKVGFIIKGLQNPLVISIIILVLFIYTVYLYRGSSFR